MTYLDALKELAGAYDIATEYTASDGARVEAPAATLIKLLEAMGVPLDADDPSEQEISLALQAVRDERASRPLPPAVVAVEGDAVAFDVHVHDGKPAHVALTLEDGSTREVTQEENWTPPATVGGVPWGEASFRIPADLPRGYHTITLDSDGRHAESRLIVTPARLSTTARYLSDRRFGVMAQLYSVRSEHSWGLGDFHDLGHLAEVLGVEIGADFLQVNPLHAAQPLPPVEDSPYLPTTRRYSNPIYLRVEDVPEYELVDDSVREGIAELAASFRRINRSSDYLERDPIYEAKLDSLHELYSVETTSERAAAFQEFIDAEGQGLIDFADWCAEQEIEQQWAGNRHAITPSVEDLRGFYMWLQFLCDEQLAAAQKRALGSGMSIGIVTDLAVGVHPGGADAANLSEWLAPDASVGAPPDGYNQKGQDWSQPPWHPTRLAEAGYEPWRAMLQTVLRHSGGIRVDHILGMFRLFWMPRMHSPETGTYVTYDHEAMVGVLALEAERAGAVVVGEDLGTFEPWVQDVLADRGLLGTSVLWFESSSTVDGPRLQDEYRQLAMSSVGTHDLPPTNGYLRGEHIRLRDELGVLTTDADDEVAEDMQWQARILNTISQAGCFAGTELDGKDFTGLAREERGKTEDLLVGLHRFIAGTPSALTVTNLVDLVGDVRIQNQPGTNAEQYANWRVPLCDAEGDAVLIEDLAGSQLFQAVGQASRR